MDKSKIWILLILIGIMAQPGLCQNPFKSIRIEEVLSIGSLDDDLIFFLTSVAVDDKGFIYLLDSLDYSIKKFDKQGSLVSQAGGKGQGPGEFQFPVIVKFADNKLYVVDQNRSGIQVFDNNLLYQGHISYPGPIFDLEVTRDNRIFILSPSIGESPPILQINNPESSISSSFEKNKEEFFKLFGKFVLDSQGNMYFMSSFEDHVGKYDKDRRLIWKKMLLGGKRSKYKYSEVSKHNIPTEMIYKDIALDKYGNLFVLGGNASENPNRDVYVLDNKGNYLTTFILQEPSHFLTIDHENFLYVKEAEGTALKKYFLEYVKK
ncbi:MAG: hypothetical protein SCM96_05080 [Acidobacteriota bacterium]|nr:hypothetical protein [Acidobacteriota bacterium]